MPERTLTVHIGLPKTATTFLQHWIFKPALGRRFIHRTRSQRAQRICRDFKDLASSKDDALPEIRAKLQREFLDLTARIPDSQSIVVSDENISGRALYFWRGQGVGPAQLSDRLRTIRTDLGDVFTTLKVIIGIRRQDQWLASRYAESSTVFQDFSQAGFDRRIAGISKLDPLGPVFDWLDYNKVYGEFSRAIGPDNVFMLSMERLKAEPESALTDLSAFVGFPGFAKIFEDLRQNDNGIIRNTLSTGDDTWRLRRDSSLLRLTAELRAPLLSRLAESNQALDRVVALHFT